MISVQQKCSTHVWEVFIKYLISIHKIFDKYSKCLRRSSQQNVKFSTNVWEEVLNKSMISVQQNVWEVFNKSMISVQQMFEKY